VADEYDDQFIVNIIQVTQMRGPSFAPHTGLTHASYRHCRRQVASHREETTLEIAMDVTEGLLALFMTGVAGIMLSASGQTIVRQFRQGRRLRRILAISAAGCAAISLALALCPTPGWVCTVWLLTVTVALTVLVAVLLTRRISPEPTTSPRRILALAAHPDDLELACGGTLARLVDTGHEVHAVIMSHGAIGGDASVRPGEAAAAGTFLGVADVTVHDLPDAHLDLVGRKLIQVIEEAIDRVQPHIILTHSAHDQHQDHHAVHEATLRAARNHHTILCFESPSVTREFSPCVFVDISDYVDVKVQSVLAHQDQASKRYMTADVIDGIVTFRGRQAKRTRAEGFEAVRMLAPEAGVF